MSALPEDLQPQQTPVNSPAARLLPVPPFKADLRVIMKRAKTVMTVRCTRQLPCHKAKGNGYVHTVSPTPLAVRRPRRKWLHMTLLYIPQIVLLLLYAIVWCSVLPNIHTMYLRDKGPYSFSADLSLKWDQGGAKAFDVCTSPTQNMLFPYTFNFGWGEHCDVCNKLWYP